ncbi:RNA polymerase sigma factor [Gemmatimonas groenlandica]|uniref:RNA polymerase sigma factor n=1 Tax=Gemmatimonas groenlandica TaxID=2732249 RepID=A0A6M4IQZ3_9BACT|nr:RNA polymerase sigma factor [Gemmatimonas groenlandica]QJR37344.1 RNA polymerase sigma factor [Gemmatimonas groenlandica]
MRDAIEAVYREESRRILATLIRLLGDFDLAEEAMQDAFTAAVERWPLEGMPANPRSWLISAGRFRAIDRLRRATRFAELDLPSVDVHEPALDDETIADDQLRLLFTCCHPALSPDAQIALTLREVCGLTTEAIAHAFITSPPTIAQRIVRAKAKIRGARIPYAVPLPADLPDLLDAVLHVIYLVFNEGYSPSSGADVTHASLSAEAIRLGRELMTLLDEPELHGLVALMLLHEARRDTRSSANGDIVLLEDQDRGRWNREMIADGSQLVKRALRSRRIGAFTLQAAIAAVHAEAPSADATDWRKIVALYDLLRRADPSPIVELNRAVAVAMRDGAAIGVAIIDDLFARGELGQYRFAHAARAELCRRAGRFADARDGFERALALSESAPERRLIELRLGSLAGHSNE